MKPYNVKSLIVAGSMLCVVFAYPRAVSAQDSIGELLRRELAEMKQQITKLVEVLKLR